MSSSRLAREAPPFAPGAQPGKARRKLRWLVGADGIYAPFIKNPKRRSKKQAAAGQPPKAEETRGVEKREIKVGVVRRLDAEGKPVTGTRWYVARREEAKGFRQWLREEALRRGVRQIDEVAVVTDGSAWLRPLRTRHFDWGVGVCDFYHAVEHLGKMGAALYGEGSPEAAVWQAQMAHRLKHEGAARIASEWKRVQYRHPKEPVEWHKQKAYFTGQLDAMDYPAVSAAHLPIGSGAAEGGCKSVIAVRFKLPGARWTEAGFDNLLALRVAYLNGMPIGPQPP